MKPVAGSAAPDEPLRCEVVCVHPGWQECIELTLCAGATLDAAVRAAQAVLIARAPGHARCVDWDAAVIGVWGRVRPRSDGLADGDRVEIYRPLHQDPKERRRERARDALRQRESGGRQGR
jgi:putative ubiquitin-RnfH superfamily antitoxin RatB of RatAB toxin-antitoxin module